MMMMRRERGARKRKAYWKELKSSQPKENVYESDEDVKERLICKNVAVVAATAALCVLFELLNSTIRAQHKRLMKLNRIQIFSLSSHTTYNSNVRPNKFLIN